MTHEQAEDFLRRNQPLPADDALTQEQISTFDEIRKFLIESPSPDLIPLMLNAFGNGGGLGVYQVCDDVFRQFTKNQMVPHLAAALASPHWGVRYWASQWAAEFPDESLVPVLARVAQDDHADCHYAAIAALEEVWRETGSKQALRAIRDQEGQPLPAEDEFAQEQIGAAEEDTVERGTEQEPIEAQIEGATITVYHMAGQELLKATLNDPRTDTLWGRAVVVGEDEKGTRAIPLDAVVEVLVHHAR